MAWARGHARMKGSTFFVSVMLSILNKAEVRIFQEAPTEWNFANLCLPFVGTFLVVHSTRCIQKTVRNSCSCGDVVQVFLPR